MGSLSSQTRKSVAVTRHIAFSYPPETTEEKFARDWEPLEKLGCTYERANRRLVAIDVPPRSDVYAVYAVLEDGEKDGLWEFEEGHCGHALRGQTPARS